MTDPVTALTTGIILNLAFQEFIKGGAGELAKKSLDGAFDLAKNLQDKISAKFKGNTKAETAIATLETDGSSTALTKLEVYLDDAMADDEVFAKEVQQIAKQIINIQNHSSSERNYINNGRDQINIETIQGNPKIGGS